MNQHDRSFVSEFEVPPHTKVRVVATVDRKLCEEMELIHKQEIERAKTEDRTEPDWSNTLEMLLRKGVRSYRSSSHRSWFLGFNCQALKNPDPERLLLLISTQKKGKEIASRF